MSKRALLILIVLFLLILVLEGVLIFLYPYRGTYPFFSSPTSKSQTTTTTTQPNQTPVLPEPTTPNPTPDTNTAELKSAVRVLDYVVNTTSPAGDTQDAYQETHQLISEKQPDGTWKVTLVSRNDRSADEVNRGTGRIETDGSFYMTELELTNADGSFICTGKLPMYLAVGKNTDTAELSCSVGGGGTAFPGLNYTGTVTASAPAPTQFAGKTYQARTHTVTGNFGVPTATGPGVVDQGIRFVSAPGIGELSSAGTLGDLLFGQLAGPVASDSTGTLVSMDNDQFFLP